LLEEKIVTQCQKFYFLDEPGRQKELVEKV